MWVLLVWRPSCTTSIAMTAPYGRGVTRFPGLAGCLACSNNSSVTTNSRSIKHYRERTGRSRRASTAAAFRRPRRRRAMHGEIERQPDRERERIDRDGHRTATPTSASTIGTTGMSGAVIDEADRHPDRQHEEGDDRVDARQHRARSPPRDASECHTCDSARTCRAIADEGAPRRRTTGSGARAHDEPSDRTTDPSQPSAPP